MPSSQILTLLLLVEKLCIICYHSQAWFFISPINTACWYNQPYYARGTIKTDLTLNFIIPRSASWHGKKWVCDKRNPHLRWNWWFREEALLAPFCRPRSKKKKYSSMKKNVFLLWQQSNQWSTMTTEPMKGHYTWNSQVIPIGFGYQQPAYTLHLLPP